MNGPGMLADRRWERIVQITRNTVSHGMLRGEFCAAE
jgi:hypothetical protein